uniref:Retrotransposon gag domain-containing protein n=1 Tax=Ananas comosus var. bracteatus TaxID=296719 RepID=A0A6V7PV13_ANACO|nr:unnamed protein product [Ananas comosus var. bracteatus]
MVESLVDSMETLFEDLYTLERDKVYLATHCLERTAKVCEKKKLQEQFQKLKQGSRTVMEYEREFSHIIDCVPDVVQDDKDRADWFERGLRADIYRAVHILKFTTFAEVLNRALWEEQENAHIRRSEKRSRRTVPGHISRYCPVRASPAPSVASAAATPAHYGGVLLAASSAGRAMVPRQSEATRSASSRRVFAAQTQAEEPAEADDRHILVGMVLINGVRSRAMFDTGATHSFISRSFARMHDIELQESKSTWRVSGPGRDFLVRKERSSCPVRLGDWIMSIRMLMFKKLKDFDVILGMDWLSKYYATIHCRSKVITFREPGQEEFIYWACRSLRFTAMVSAMRARKLINSGFVAYLATVVEVERTTLALEKLSVVRKFPDTSRSRDSVCEWFDLRANRLDLAKGMIMAFHISGKIGGVGGRTHWELCLVLTPCFTEPSTSACVEDRGKGIAP